MDILLQLKSKLQALLYQAGQSTIDSTIDAAKFTSNTLDKIDNAGLMGPIVASGISATGRPDIGSAISADVALNTFHPQDAVTLQGPLVRLPRINELTGFNTNHVLRERNRKYGIDYYKS